MYILQRSLYMGINAVDSFYPAEGQAGKLRALNKADSLEKDDDGQLALSGGHTHTKKSFWASETGLLVILWSVCTAPFAILLVLVENETVYAPSFLIENAEHDQVTHDCVWERKNVSVCITSVCVCIFENMLICR
jgi:hypothetical protein